MQRRFHRRDSRDTENIGGLGVTVATVKAALHRGREKLQATSDSDAEAAGVTVATVESGAASRERARQRGARASVA